MVMVIIMIMGIGACVRACMRAGVVLFGVVCAVCHDSHDYMDYCQCQCQCGTILLLLLEQQQLLSGLSSSSSLCGVPQLPASLTASSFRRPVSGTVYGLFSYATYIWGIRMVRMGCSSVVWVVRMVRKKQNTGDSTADCCCCFVFGLGTG